MPKPDTSINDIAQSIADLSNMVAAEIGSLSNRVDSLSGRVNSLDNRMEAGFQQVDQRLTTLEYDQQSLVSGQRHMTQQLTDIDGRLETVENDVKDIYGMIAPVADF